MVFSTILYPYLSHDFPQLAKLTEHKTHKVSTSDFQIMFGQLILGNVILTYVSLPNNSTQEHNIIHTHRHTEIWINGLEGRIHYKYLQRNSSLVIIILLVGDFPLCWILRNIQYPSSSRKFWFSSFFYLFTGRVGEFDVAPKQRKFIQPK